MSGQVDTKHKEIMNVQDLFDQHVEEYDAWFDQYPHVFQSELEAIRKMLPEADNQSGIEVGLGTGRFSQALHLKSGVEPSENMRAKAATRGIEALNAVAEHLPFPDLTLDFVLMISCICFFKRPDIAFGEAFRVLKNDGVLVVGFIDKESAIGRKYDRTKNESKFYRGANFYSVDKIVNELSEAGFQYFSFCQTLFGSLDDIHEFQPAEEGYGEGSFVVIKAFKKFPPK
jgi:SAM-dependent methyltransferase